MTNRFRKMTIILAVALFAAALLSACGGSSKKDRAQQESADVQQEPVDAQQEPEDDNAQEENKRNPGSYDVRTYLMSESGTRYLDRTEEVYVDSKGRKIRSIDRSADGESYSEVNWAYDDLDRVIYWEYKGSGSLYDTDFPYGTEFCDSYRSYTVYDGDSDRVLYEMVKIAKSDGEDYYTICENQYDEHGNVIFSKALDSRKGEHYRICCDSYLRDGIRVVRDYRVEYAYGGGWAEGDISDEAQKEWYYDENGRLLCAIDNNSEWHHETVYEYDRQGRCVSKTWRDQSGNLVYEEREEYYGDRVQEIKETDYYDGYTVECVCEYRWNVKDSSFPKGKVNICTKRTYEKGDLVSVNEYYFEGADASVGEFDKNVFQVRRLVSGPEEGASGEVSSGEWEITVDPVFDTNGNLLKKTHYYGEKSSIVYEFDDHQNVVKEYSFDWKGELIPDNYYEYEYTYY